MTFDELLVTLVEKNVRLSVNEGSLSISAGKGILTPEITTELKRYKQEMIAWLARTEKAAYLMDADASDLESDTYEPFPFSDLQIGFYMAADSFLEFHVRPHYYCEWDKDILNIPRYERAINLALERHKGEMVVVVDDGHLRALEELFHVPLRVNDFRAMSQERCDAELQKLRSRFMREELPLDSWPWFHIEVSISKSDTEDRFRIHANYNNFYSDGFGTTLFQRDVEHYYANPDEPLPPIRLTYRTAILKLAALSESDAGQKAKKYWLDRLHDLPAPPDLPVRPLVNRRVRSKLIRREGRLSAHSWNKVKQFGREKGLTPTSTIIAAYAEILSIWSGSQHFILSNMVTRRLPVHDEIMQVIGNFASLYPLEIDLRNADSFAEKARRVQQQILRDSDNREWGGMQVMQAFNRARGEFGSTPCPFVVGSGLFMEKYKKADFSCLETSQTMLDHQFWELEDGSYYYVWDLLEEFFPVGMINSMWQALGLLLQHLSIDARNWQTTFFPAVAEQPVVDPLNDPIIDCSPYLLHSNVSVIAERASEKNVLTSPLRSLTYLELDRSSRAIARQLLDRDIGVNQLVAIVMDRGAEQMIGAFGILSAGAAYVPIDPSLPHERIRYLLENSRCEIVLTQSKYLSLLTWPSAVEVIVVDSEQCRPVDGPLPTVHFDDLAYVIYTSGSTGNPKGVMIDHRGAMNTILDINQRFSVNETDTVFGVSSFSFDLSVYDLFGVVTAAARLVYPEPEMALNPSHWLDLMIAESVTIWNSAPPLMRLLTDIALRRGVTLPSLRLVMLSGDWIPIELPNLIRKIAPDAEIVGLGGATEASIWSIYYNIDRVDPEWVSIPYGRPMTKQGWMIRDSLGRPTPTWVTGELYITGIGLAVGYWADPAKTERAFTTDSDTGQRMYRTGDRGRYLPDGNIEFMGRLDSQVKVQGHRIELGEIETALAAHPAVKESVVLARPVAADDSHKASGPEIRSNRALQLNAYVVFQPDANRSIDRIEARRDIVATLREFLGEKLPTYMVPTEWTFLDEIPLTSNGKVDRKSLVALSNSDVVDDATRSQSVAPRTPIETAIVEIWQTVLSRTNIGVQDDFFALGGQSFDAVRSIALIRERLGQSISLADVWRCRTIEGLAAVIERPNANRTRQHLVEINAVARGRPHFFVHPAGGHASGYYALGQLLECPSYGFVALTDDAALDGLATIDMIAARYVRELKRIQPEGPYSLCGWSSGGCIAFDIAVQLENMGDRVARVVMIDCPSPMMHDRIDEVDMLLGFFEDLYGKPLSGIDRASLENSESSRRFDDALSVFNRETEQFLDSTQLNLVFRVFKKIVDAVRSYQPTRIHADIVVVRAIEGIVTEFANHPETENPGWGWQHFTKGKVTTRMLPGTHHSLLQPPYVNAVAEYINGLSEVAQNLPICT